MFQIKIDDNNNLLLIWPHREGEGAVLQKNVKVPKM